MFRKILTAACLSLGFAAFSPMASADLIPPSPFDSGNDCAGAFGDNFPSCKIPIDVDPNESPIIIKFNFNDQGVVTSVEVNSALFPTISLTGDEFDFQITGAGTGIWTYTPGPGDPGINFFVAKGGPDFNLFSNLGDPLSDSWTTPINPNNDQPFGLSHLSFYDTNGTVKIPEPATLVLLSLGLIGLAIIRRRKQ